MSSKKNNTEKYNNNNNNDDLTFIPLDINSSLAPNSIKFPLQFDIEGVSVTKTLGTISLGFPNLNINPTPVPLTTSPMTELAPLTPYPKNIPTIDSNTSLNEKSTTKNNTTNNKINNNTNNKTNSTSKVNSNNKNNVVMYNTGNPLFILIITLVLLLFGGFKGSNKK